jgi:glycosyltransferase involved in cell wall biosynthesis
MVHEPYLQFKLKSLRQAGVAFVHRLMTILLLQASNSVYVSIPEWEARWRPYALGRKVRFEWLPIPSNIEVASDSEAVQAIRRRYAPADNLLLGHFSSFGSLVCSLLEPILSRLVANGTDHPILLIGKGSNEFREQFVQREPAAAKYLHATGTLSLPEISAHLAASDVLIQPYPDGVSTRRTSFMAGLSHGKPIVTTAGELTEPFWLRTDCVGLAPAADLNSFVDLAQRLCRVEAERIRMGNAARLFYLERFEMSHTITRLRGMAAGENLTCAS